MSDEAPLTDEELAEVERCESDEADALGCDAMSTHVFALRMVAEIRRLRAEVAEVWRANEIQTGMQRALRVGAAPAQLILADVHQALRIACEDIGDNSWSDDLHPADVVDKYLARVAGGNLARLCEIVAKAYLAGPPIGDQSSWDPCNGPIECVWCKATADLGQQVTHGPACPWLAIEAEVRR